MDWNKVEPLNNLCHNVLDGSGEQAVWNFSGWDTQGDVHMIRPEELYKVPWKYYFSEHRPPLIKATKFQEPGDDNPEVLLSLIKE